MNEQEQAKASHPLSVRSTDPAHALNMIHKLVRKVLSPSFDRDDLAMEIWLKLYELDQPISFMKVRFMCLDLVAREKRRSYVEKEHEKVVLIERSESESKHSYPKHEQTEMLDSLMKEVSLSKKQKDILFHIFYQGQRAREVAHLLGISESYVSKLLSQALTLLKERLISCTAMTNTAESTGSRHRVL